MGENIDYIKRICCVVIYAVILLDSSSVCWAAEQPAQQTFISANNRKIVSYTDGRLVFYDGLGTNARSVADVNCKNEIIIPSKTGKYLATCSQFFGAAGPARIFNDRGEKIGEFPLQGLWKVQAITDQGDLVALHKVYFDAGQQVVRLCDLKGNTIADFNNNETDTTFYNKFASDGTPIIWGKKQDSKNRSSYNHFVFILDKKGQIIKKYEKPSQDYYIEELLPSAQATTIVFFEHAGKATILDDKVITIWNPKSGSVKMFALPLDLGSIGQFNAISPSGSYAVVRLGAKAISLIDTVKGSEVLHKNIDFPLVDSYSFTQILQAEVTDAGTILVLGHSDDFVGYCVLDKTGNIKQSKRLEDFGKYENISGRVKIQEMPSDKFAIVHERNKVEIVDLH